MITVGRLIYFPALITSNQFTALSTPSARRMIRIFEQSPCVVAVRLDLRVVSSTCVVSVTTFHVFGLVPFTSPFLIYNRQEFVRARHTPANVHCSEQYTAKITNHGQYNL